MDRKENNIIIYQDEDGITKVTVRFVGEDIWLTQNQIAEIYKTTQENISIHIKNIYKDKELNNDSTNKKFLLVQNEGNRQVKRNIDHYNLDMIIALGYRYNHKLLQDLEYGQRKDCMNIFKKVLPLMMKDIYNGNTQLKCQKNT